MMETNTKKIRKVATNDGSTTFHNSKYDETYHSVSGAVEEAIKKFAEPCDVRTIAMSGEIKILDICFGIGYNSAAAVDLAGKVNKDCRIEITGLENDNDILQKIPEINVEFDVGINAGFEKYNLFKEAVKKKTKTLHTENVKIKIILGDARKSIKKLIRNNQDKYLNYFDAVFLDPFSPKKCPELWTEEFFKDIYAVMKPKAILATYSCARVVRDNLKKAGFTVKDGPIVGRRAPGTVAVKQ